MKKTIVKKCQLPQSLSGSAAKMQDIVRHEKVGQRSSASKEKK